MVVELADVDKVEATVPAIRAALKTAQKKVDYEIIVPLELLRQAEETKRIFNIVLGSIAGISLIVGGIGIMNIMLATVTERTREIGIRRALGAQRSQIITPFLVETVLLPTPCLLHTSDAAADPPCVNPGGLRVNHNNRKSLKTTHTTARICS